MLLQTNAGVERFLANDLLSTVAIAVDLAAIAGSVANGQPTGIINTAGVGSVTGTSLNTAGVLEFQTDVANALAETSGYATTAAVLAARVATGTQSYLWQGSLYNGVLGGLRAMSSAQVPTGDMVFGDWSRLIVGGWGTLQVEINPFAIFPAGVLGARVLFVLDVGCVMPTAFSIATSVT